MRSAEICGGKSIAVLEDRTAPRREARGGQVVDPEGMPTLGVGDPSRLLLLSLAFPDASIGAAHLCTLVFGELCAVIRRLGRIQSE